VRLAPDAVPDVDCVVHLAHHPHVTFPDHAEELHRLNTTATLELLEAARHRGAARFVYASSGAVYGYGDHPFDEREPPTASDFYALTKLHAEALLRTYTPFFATSVVRPFFPYGPGQRDRLIPRLADRIAAGEPIQLRPDGHPRVNPIFVDDAVEAVVAAVEGRAPAILNLAGPDVVSIRELADLIGSIVGAEPVVADGAEAPAGDLIGATSAVVGVLDRTLVPLEEGLRRTLV
jgi:nucleoside-diphosphate-sugar epimerase